MSTESSTGTPGRVRPLRLLVALALSLVVISASNYLLTVIGTAIFSAPDDFCAFQLRYSVPMTLEWVALATIVWGVLVHYTTRPAWWFYQVTRVFVVVAWAASLFTLATWRSVLGVVTLDIMVVVGATVTYLALTRIAPTNQLATA
ncbi:hypothetical protein [Kutzneria sp. CA-103260]|uniref:hypothetical protein n=1 Tax=Kutzneria sp. CA-103260 TaxID=2802641 RepID=UPI001BA50DD0|nr:hypothetical protein [Kutzneria sp. CA-103260]QUQ67750.1 hypothetical protein JJ691_54850 [Kutzneria sp. CA-103260]